MSCYSAGRMEAYKRRFKSVKGKSKGIYTQKGQRKRPEPLA